MTVTAALASQDPISRKRGWLRAEEPIAAHIVGGVSSTIHVLILNAGVLMMMKEQGTRKESWNDGEEVYFEHLVQIQVLYRAD